MTKKWEPETVFDVLASEEARKILALASVEPISAQAIADRLDVSEPTVYRRVNVLQEYDFLSAETRVDAAGNHFETYRTSLSSVEVAIEGGTFSVDIGLQRDVLDGVDLLWEDEEADDGHRDPVDRARDDGADPGDRADDGTGSGGDREWPADGGVSADEI